jgi:hypothetical protein
MPQFQHQQAPQNGMVIALRGHMLLQQALYALRPEVAALAGPRAEKNVTREILQLVTKPVLDRDAEAHLRSSQYGFRKDAPHEPTHKVFPPPPAQLQRRRQARRELNDRMVEKGRP